MTRIGFLDLLSDLRLLLVVAIAAILIALVLIIEERPRTVTAAFRRLWDRWRYSRPHIFGLFRPGAALAGLFLLAACATAQGNEGKGLSAAQDSVAAAAQAVHAAYASGAISKAQVARAAALVDKADDLSRAARAAYASGDASTASGDVSQILALVAQIKEVAAAR